MTDLVEQQAGGASPLQDPVLLLAAVRKDAARRSSKYQLVFDETAKTLVLLSDHRLLKKDTQFLGLLDALTGVEDADIMNDRLMALVAYVGKVAQDHGVAPTANTVGAAASIMMDQRPQSLADPDDVQFQRTRLQVR